MRICDLTQAWTPTSGGIRTYLEAKRRWFATEGGHTHILVVPGQRDAVRREPGAVTYTVAAPRVPGAAPYRMILRAEALRAILAAEQPDIIEHASPFVLPRAARAHRAVADCRVVGFYHTDVPTAYAPRPLRAAAAAWVRAVYQRADATIAASPALAARLGALGVPRVHTVPLGVDADLFHPARRDEALRAALGAGPGDTLFVYAGRFDVEKRPDLVLEAFAALPPDDRGRLVLMGEGPLRERIVARAATVPGVVVLPYEANRARLATLLATADVYVSAAAHETFGLAVLEAQACGLPVVGVRAGAMLERVPAGLGRLGAPGSVAELTANLHATMHNGRRAQGRRARAHVEASYSWGATFRRLLALYASLR